VLLLEFSNIHSDLFEMQLLVVARNRVVGTICLIARDKVGIVDGSLRDHRLDETPQLVLQLRLEHLQRAILLQQLGQFDQT
jgi:hypothetical protein